MAGSRHDAPHPGLGAARGMRGWVTPNAGQKTTGRNGCRRAVGARQRPSRSSCSCSPRGRAGRHPDYSVDFTDDELRGLYRDLVMVRKLDAEATALQRQGELGIWASLLGQEAAQVGSGRALRDAGHGVPDLPRARRALLPRHRPDHAARPVPRRGPGRLGPATSSSSTCTRSSSARRRCTRPATPWASAMDGKVGGDDSEAVIAYFGDGATTPGRRQRGVHLGQRVQRADRVLLPEQPVRDLRAAGAADPRPAVPARGRLRLPRRPGRRQRRAGRATR